MELHTAAEILPTVVLQKKQGMESKNCPIIDTFGCYFWKAIAPEASSRGRSRGTPKLGLEVGRVCTIDERPCPLLVIYTYYASTSDYTCCPNICYSNFTYEACVSSCVLATGRLIALNFALWQGQR